MPLPEEFDMAAALVLTYDTFQQEVLEAT